jgi:hypothetical protein
VAVLNFEIRYASPIHSWEPLGSTLIEYSQDNPLLDASRQALAIEFPRRQFDTHRQITVGGLKAFKGSYWTGNERHLGLAQLDDLVRAQKLGFVGGAHLMSRKLGQIDGSPGSGEFLSSRVTVEFTRPDHPAGARASIQSVGGGWEPHLGHFVDATWQVFCDLLDAAPVESGVGAWHIRWLTVPEGRLRIGSLLFLPSPVVASFGGPEEAIGELGAIDDHPVGGDAADNGLALRLWRDHGDVSPEREDELARLLHRHGMPVTLAN